MPFRPAAIVLYGCILLAACNSSRQVSVPVTPQSIASGIDSSKWKFSPSQVMPQYGSNRQVNGNGYTVTCYGKKLTVYLPYYGRAYGSADLVSGRGPLDFTAVDYTSSKQQVKEGEWNVVIKPGNNEVQSMQFTLYSNGSARLEIIMTNRSAISYIGSILPLL